MLTADDAAFDSIRASFRAMVRRDLPDTLDLAAIEADHGGAFFLLMQLVMSAVREGRPDPAPWFTAWCVECPSRPGRPREAPDRPEQAQLISND
jgi:hypothetical protein